ncbi:MAG: winged helix-turn-helix domain-containing protein [Pseudomonadota bacterium]
MTDGSPPDLQDFQLGEFTVRPLERLIVGPDGVEHELTGKKMDVLVYLARRAGQVVTRKALMDDVWQGRAVGDDVLNNATSVLRRVLGDKPSNPEYLRTVHGVGYQIIATVSDVQTSPTREPRSVPWIAVVLVTAAVLVGTALWLRSPKDTVDVFLPGQSPVILVGSSATDSTAAAPTYMEILAQLLSQSPAINFSGQDYVQVVTERTLGAQRRWLSLDEGLKVAREGGAAILVHTAFMQADDGFSVRADIVDMSDNDRRTTIRFTSDSALDFIDGLEVFGQRLRERLGEDDETILAYSRAPKDAISREFQVLDLYSKALQARRDHQFELAIRFCSEAIAIDPNAALVYLLRGRLYYGQHNQREEAERDWEQASTLAGRLSHKDRLHLNALKTKFMNRRDMEREWRLLKSSYPLMPRAHYEYGNALWYYFDDHINAALAYEKAHELAPEAYYNGYYGAYAVLGQNRFDDAIRAFSNIQKKFQSYHNFGLSDALVAAGQHDDAEAILFTDQGRRPELTAPHQKVIALYIDQGRLKDVANELLTFKARSDRFDWGELAIHIPYLAVARLDQPPQQWSEQVALRVENAIRTLDTSEPSDLVPFVQVAILIKWAARSGHLDLAERLYAATTAHGDFKARRGTVYQMTLAEAEIARARGDLQASKKLLIQLIADTDTLQARESLAALYVAQQDMDDATDMYQWIVDHRGWAFSQGKFTYGRSDAIAIWAEAHRHLGSLHAQAGNPDQAEAVWRSLWSHWKSGDRTFHQKQSLKNDLCALTSEADYCS